MRLPGASLNIKKIQCLQLIQQRLFQKIVHSRAGLPGYKAGMPGIQRRDLPHLVLCQSKVENAQVFRHSLRVCGFYDGHDAALRQPAELHLCVSFLMACSDGAERFIPEEVRLPCGQGRPRLHLNVLALHVGAFILPLEEGIALHQIDRRFYLVPKDEVRQLVRGEVMKLLVAQSENGGRRRNAAKKKELVAAEECITELFVIFKRLYEDSMTGRISDARFMKLSADYEQERAGLKGRAAQLRAELSKE